MNAPRTAREALIAEMLGDLDTILARVEAVPALVSTAEEKIAATVKILEETGDRYRLAVTAFNEQAKTELSEYFDRKASQVAAKTYEEQRAAIQEIARSAFQTEAYEKAASLGIALSEAAKEFRRSKWSRMIEHSVTALLASVTTLSIVLAIVKLPH